MERARSALLIASATAIGLSAPIHIGRADIIPPPSIHSAVQRGQSVEITIETQQTGVAAENDKTGLRVTRDDKNRTVELFDKRIFGEDESLMCRSQPLGTRLMGTHSLISVLAAIF